MKNDLPYFSHDNDARNHAKMKALRARFGWTGYGQFWALNEMIAGSDGARLDLSRKVVRSACACELGMTTDALDDFIAFLSDQNECGLVDFNDGILTTDRTQEEIEKVMNHRESARAAKGAKKEQKPELRETSRKLRETLQEGSSKVARSFEQSRVDKSREEKREENISAVAAKDDDRDPWDEEPPVELAPAHQPKTKPATKSKAEPRDPLRDALAASFRAKVPEYANPARENKNLLALTLAIRRKAKAADYAEETAARGVVETMWRLHESGKSFWADFTPSKALAGLEQLWGEWAKGHAASDMSWLEEGA